VFYTPGWGVILGVGGTLAGVAITQAANSWSTGRARRKERDDRINDAVCDLIALGNTWANMVSACEQAAFDAVRRKLGEDDLRAALTSARAYVHSAQDAYGRAFARVRLTCPPSIFDAAERFTAAMQNFDGEMATKVEVALNTGNADINKSEPHDAVDRLNALVEVTRKATGRGPVNP
jgi:hypothetical protein